MATIRLTITVEDIDETLLFFDVLKVYRASTIGGTYLEITTPATRPPLVAGQSVYEFVDAAGDPAYYYKSSFFNSVTTAESSLSDPRQGSVDPLYIDVDDLRKEGLTIVAGSADEERALERIATFQSIIESITRQFFIPKQMTLDLDGNGTTLLPLPHPIVSITSLYTNEDFENALAVDEFVAYDGRGEDDRDDRRNPRIKLVSEEQSIFAGVGPVGRTGAVFEVGEQNQRVVGTFGWVEPDGCVPPPIRYALKKLVVSNFGKLGLAAGGGGGGGPAGPVIEEETDRHRKRWADPYVGTKAWTTTGDVEVDLILARFKRAIVVRGPRTLHGRNRWSSGL